MLDAAPRYYFATCTWLLAQRALEANDVRTAVSLLNKHRPADSSLATRHSSLATDLRGWEWRYLWQLCQPDESVRLRANSGSIGGMAISQDGRLTVKVSGSDDPIEVGQLELYRFVNPAGLESIGENLMKVTNGSGDPIPGRPGFDGMGKVQQKFLEMSNVSVVKEMVNMIVAQRAYEFNSKSVQTSDNVLGIVANLKRS